jgi:hypothetical protein
LAAVKSIYRLMWEWLVAKCPGMTFSDIFLFFGAKILIALLSIIYPLSSVNCDWLLTVK